MVNGEAKGPNTRINTNIHSLGVVTTGPLLTVQTMVARVLAHSSGTVKLQLPHHLAQCALAKEGRQAPVIADGALQCTQENKM